LNFYNINLQLYFIPLKTDTPVTLSAEKKKTELEPEYEVLFERQWRGQSDEDCFNEYVTMQFASELSSNERAIIDLLDKDSLMPSEGIAKVVKLTVKEVNAIIKDLVSRGLIKSGSPTKNATDIVEEDGAKTFDIEIKYKYDWRPDVTPDDRSREKCKEWLGKYSKPSGWLTRPEINNLSNGQDLPVFDSRGGWWNKDGASLPYCRHDWFQMVVKKK